MPCAPGRRRIQSFICSRESVRRWGRRNRPGRPLDMLAVKIWVFALTALADVEESAGLVMAAAPPIVFRADWGAVGGLGQLPLRSTSSVRLQLLAFALAFARPVRGITMRLRRRHTALLGVEREGDDEVAVEKLNLIDSLLVTISQRGHLAISQPLADGLSALMFKGQNQTPRRSPSPSH